MPSRCEAHTQVCHSHMTSTGMCHAPSFSSGNTHSHVLTFSSHSPMLNTPSGNAYKQTNKTQQSGYRGQH